MAKMGKNIGLIDRIIRFILSIILGYFFFAGLVPGFWKYIVLFLAITFLATSIISHCCLYELFHISTLKKKEKQEVQ